MGMKISGISAKKFVEKPKPSQACDIIWEIIRKYHIKMGFAEGRTEKELLSWVNFKIKPYVGQHKGVNRAYNWDWSWHNGYNLAALVDTEKPGCVDWDRIKSGKNRKNMEYVLRLGGETHDVPRIVDIEDLIYSPTPRTLMTYISFFKHKGDASVDLSRSVVRLTHVKIDDDDDESSSESDDSEFEEEEHVSEDDEKAKEMALLRLKHGWTMASIPRDGVTDPVIFMIFAKNAEGDPVFNVKCQILFTGPNGDVDVKMEDIGDGAFRASYASLPPGDYEINVSLNEGNVRNYPLTFNVPKPLDPEQCYAEGPGLLPAGESGNFTVHAMDSGGELITGVKCSVSMTGPNDDPIFVEVSDNLDGTFSARYDHPLPTGEYKILVLLNKKPIRGMPIEFNVERQFCPDHSYAEGP